MYTLFKCVYVCMGDLFQLRIHVCFCQRVSDILQRKSFNFLNARDAI